MRYLLDANIISNLVRFPKGVVCQKLDEVGHDKVFTSIIVSAEIKFGVEKNGSAELASKVGAVLSRIPVLSLEAPADANYASIRAQLEKLRNTIGPNDLLIASHALALSAIMVTHNEREFSRVPGLKVENWLRES
jgi:tRNA(fMet)-specific endonuclease VapC